MELRWIWLRGGDVSHLEAVGLPIANAGLRQRFGVRR